MTDTARLFRQVFEKTATENGLGLTPGEIRALAHAMRFSGSRQAVLAERLGVEPMTLSAYLDRLEARGLVRRTVDPADRRAKLVEPTEAAEAVIRQLEPLFEKMKAQATAGLSPEAVEALMDALGAMRDNLTSDCAPPDGRTAREAPAEAGTASRGKTASRR
ncbi:MarR family winged helix-turn-helix transcriptional regulator [Aureimonas populi]|uniref:MarR family winged helix-turn-helix transcriptional regulator n=1 Tax=Aureimonas populi TaxID=1701758 RepID=UPI001FD8571B|nr:MarR family winged helix-turn-helix transcriptional regulator [Aureimonas populi]